MFAIACKLSGEFPVAGAGAGAGASLSLSRIGIGGGVLFCCTSTISTCGTGCAAMYLLISMKWMMSMSPISSSR